MPETKHPSPPEVLRLVMISATIGIIGGFFMIGVPGFLMLELIARIYDALGIQVLELSGDQVWPTAIMISLLWPAFITPLSVFYFKIWNHQSLLNRWFFSLFGSILLTATCVFLMIL